MTSLPAAIIPGMAESLPNELRLGLEVKAADARTDQYAGGYSFSVLEAVAKGELRPLRNPADEE